MKNRTLETLARNLVADKIENGEELNMEWMVYELLVQFLPVSGCDTGFQLLCAKEHLYVILKQVTADRQEGWWDHIRESYTVERSGARLLVPIELLSSEELLARSAQFSRQAKALDEHASELKTYVEYRESVLRVAE